MVSRQNLVGSCYMKVEVTGRFAKAYLVCGCQHWQGALHACHKDCQVASMNKISELGLHVYINFGTHFIGGHLP